MTTLETSSQPKLAPTLLTANLVDCEFLPNNIHRLWLKLPDNTHFSYRAGQYLYLVLADGEERPYSIASAPDKHILEFHIHHQPGDHTFTHLLFDELLRTKTIRLHGPFGHCVYHPPKQERWILLAGGTGLAPCKAMIEAAINDSNRKPIDLYWGVRSLHHLYADDLLNQWQTEHSWFRYIPVLFTADKTILDYRFGMVHEALLEDYPSLQSLLVYASGPVPMVLSAQKYLFEQGLPTEQFCSDYT